MSARTEKSIDIIVAMASGFTKLTSTTMRWDGSGPEMGKVFNPTLLINGSLVNPVSQMVEVSDVFTLAE